VSLLYAVPAWSTRAYALRMTEDPYGRPYAVPAWSYARAAQAHVRGLTPATQKQLFRSVFDGQEVPSSDNPIT